MKNLFVIFLLLIHLTSCSQSIVKESRYLPGTNIKIDIPSNFIKSIEFSGYIDSTDGTKIFGMQSKLPLTFEEAIISQENSIKKAGLKIINTTKFKHNEQDAIMFEYESPQDKLIYLLLFFGEDKNQNFISANFPKKRLKEIEIIIKSSKLDNTVTINPEEIIGFKANENSGPLKRVDVNGMVMNYEERDTEGKLISYLKLSKFPKGNLKDASNEEATHVIAEYYFKEYQFISKDTIHDKNNDIFQKLVEN